MNIISQDNNWMTTEDLRMRLKLKSKHRIDSMRRAREIPYYSFGAHAFRFYWPDVCEALEKFEVPAVKR